MLQFFNKYIGFKNLIFFILALLFILFIIQIKDIAILFFASFVISCSLNPIVDKICDKFKMNRAAASSIVLIGTLMIMFLFIFMIIYYSLSRSNWTCITMSST